MPSKSAKQHRLMEAVKHDPAFAKKAGIPQEVGAEFADADEASGTPFTPTVQPTTKQKAPRKLRGKYKKGVK